MRREFIIDGGITTEEFPLGSMLCRFSSTKWQPCGYSSVQTLQDGPMPLQDARWGS